MTNASPLLVALRLLRLTLLFNVQLGFSALSFFAAALLPICSGPASTMRDLDEVVNAGDFVATV